MLGRAECASGDPAVRLEVRRDGRMSLMHVGTMPVLASVEGAREAFLKPERAHAWLPRTELKEGRAAIRLPPRFCRASNNSLQNGPGSETSSSLIHRLIWRVRVIG